jgi:hypothetical protein
VWVLWTEREGTQTEARRDLLPQVSSLILAMVGQPPPYLLYRLARLAGKGEESWWWLTDWAIVLAHGVSPAQGEGVGLGQGAIPQTFLGWSKKVNTKGVENEKNI